MKVKLKGWLRNYLYHNAQWLFLILYGKKCRFTLLYYILMLAIAQIFVISSRDSWGISVVVVGICQLLCVFLLWRTRNYISISNWLDNNRHLIKYD